jgi:hypothetical protein
LRDIHGQSVQFRFRTVECEHLDGADEHDEKHGHDNGEFNGRDTAPSKPIAEKFM